MPRLFIALPFDEAEFKEEGYTEPGTLQHAHTYLKKFNKELKVVTPENFHITLKFFGECNDKTAGKIMDNFQNIKALKRKLTYSLAGVGVFPNLKKADVIWAGLKTDESVITKLLNDIDFFASDLGFKKEKRKFVPHLTLARVRKGMSLNESLRQYIVENKETFYCESTFKNIVLFESKLNQDGAIYTELQSIPLIQTNQTAIEED
ncbi:MAG: RNA 2',3'-cyclic phosphodiesterase [Spirochaetes bacterium]|nr:RNA 2',3'-cyclic phosphodiesterase [Spirochaetota bacterium]